jgi:hypothetical protein
VSMQRPVFVLLPAAPHTVEPAGQLVAQKRVAVHTPPPAHCGVQLLAAHFWPKPHAFPQAPQLFGSVWVSVQQPPHATVPAGQLVDEPPQPAEPPQRSAQVPWLQPWPAGQTLPQTPQFSESACKSTQRPVFVLLLPAPHTAEPAGQLVAQKRVAVHTPPPAHCGVQLLAAHFWPKPHAFPQAPQLFGSVWVSVQQPPHATVPAGQLVDEPPQPAEPPQRSAQVPWLQPWPAGQTLPHVPQLVRSLLRLTHVPDASEQITAPASGRRSGQQMVAGPATMHSEPLPPTAMGQHGSGGHPGT